ncbi:aminotransferase-like domain-containing protein [Bradyrhizobium cenepequi]|uniref:aminotransferase-like domain-containing protein n=1 Tax=Bradyrhizobium cenepequi TaxID=2821403 RepID=UPI001CE366C9|nr:PLP-dependent aminotransferase family protein [Bradyrhizobium cenepequi]MCA6107919.1 PLP-dependent aminotransferase family protein [Bradyrhizobium cenepequi]
MSISHNTVELVRATPPVLTAVSDILGESLREISQDERTGVAFHKHRFGGDLADREAGAIWCEGRLGTAVDPSRVVVTNGTQNSLLMLVASLVPPGSVLLTEALSYPQIGTLCNLVGATARSVKLDELGVVPDDFKRCCEEYRPKAAYLIPTVQNPTATILPSNRRHEIVAIARKHGVAIIEDEAQAFLPPNADAPIASLAPDTTWYVLTMSKSTSVGLRVGYFVAPDLRQLENVYARFKKMSMWFSSPITAILATRWITDGTANRILAAIRGEMAERHRILRDELTNVSYQSSPNSLHVWVKGASGLRDAAAIGEWASQRGVIVRGWNEFQVADSGGPHGARVSLTAGDQEALRTGLRKLNAGLGAQC